MHIANIFNSIENSRFSQSLRHQNKTPLEEKRDFNFQKYY